MLPATIKFDYGFPGRIKLGALPKQEILTRPEAIIKDGVATGQDIGAIKFVYTHCDEIDDATVLDIVGTLLSQRTTGRSHAGKGWYDYMTVPMDSVIEIDVREVLAKTERAKKEPDSAEVIQFKSLMAKVKAGEMSKDDLADALLELSNNLPD